MKRVLYLGLDPSHFKTEGFVFHWPIIEITPTPFETPSIQEALHHFRSYSHLIVTSKTTVPILHSYLNHLQMQENPWQDKKILAVGRVTAESLEKHGYRNILVAKEEMAEGIIALLEEEKQAIAHLFYPHSSLSRPLIEERLKNLGITHTSCIVYQTERKNWKKEELPALASFDEIVFTSPSTVEAFLFYFGSLPQGILITPIGEITAQAINLYS